MRAFIVSLIVLGAMTVITRPAASAPPDDITVYCRSTFAATQAQVRCLFTERSAQERVIHARAAVAPDAWARCAGGSASWTAMEGCLVQTGPSGGGATAVGGAAAPSAGAERDDGQAEQAGDAAPSATADAPSLADGNPPSAIEPSTSTIILGPQGTAASAREPARPTWPVPEAEAERHLKSVLERSGESAARCTKRQYSGGWVTVCE